jgi:uncharacterized protein
VIPFAALTAFADPHVQFGLRFRAAPMEAANMPEPDPDPQPEITAEPVVAEAPQVVSLDAFRKRKD